MDYGREVERLSSEFKRRSVDVGIIFMYRFLTQETSVFTSSGIQRLIQITEKLQPKSL